MECGMRRQNPSTWSKPTTNESSVPLWLCLNTKLKRNESLQGIGNHFLPSCVSLASVVTNLTAQDAKTSAGIMDSGMRLEGHCRRVLSSTHSVAGRQRACGMDLF